MSDQAISTRYQFRLKDSILGFQNLFIAFGALVLVPILTGLDPCVSLLTAGLGTLVFQLCTKGKVPIFLGSSFAFIAPTIYGVSHWGVSATLSGLAATGAVYLALSLLVLWRGREFLIKLFPPVVTGPIIVSIGLMLAPIAANMAMGKTGDGSMQLLPQDQAIIIASIALFSAIFTRLYGFKHLKLVPVIVGIVSGYAAAYFMGFVDLSVVQHAPMFKIPAMVLPTWHWPAVMYIAPVALVTSIEHVGDIVAIGSITRQDFIKEPGLHRTLLGDGLASTLAAFLGGPPNTTYAEVTAGVALTRAFNPAIMTWSAIIAIYLAFNAKLGIFLQTIPVPVMGGIMILLFGTIAVVGLHTLIESKTDVMSARSMCIIAVILVLSLGGLQITIGEFVLNGIALSGCLGVLLNLLLPRDKPESMPKTM